MTTELAYISSYVDKSKWQAFKNRYSECILFFHWYEDRFVVFFEDAERVQEIIHPKVVINETMVFGKDSLGDDLDQLFNAQQCVAYCGSIDKIIRDNK